MATARSQTVFPEETQILHIWCRVVRKSFLCGFDRLLNRDYDHRKEWVREKIKFSAEIYAIDVITFAILDNHYHLVVRTRPDVVAAMTNEEVVRSILRLGGEYWFNSDGSDRKKTRKEINRRLNDKQWLLKARVRLSNISKMMQTINQSIARRANKEDGVLGRFFEARFGHEVLVDMPDVLACAMYIDLNPVRANKANTPEDSEYTGAYERVSDLRMFIAEQNGSYRMGVTHSSDAIHQWERLGEGNSGWLSPLSIDERKDPVGPDRTEPIDLETMMRRRASNKGVFSMTLMEYLELLDFTGRRYRADKRGMIDESVPSVLERLGFDFEDLEAKVEYLAVTHALYFESTERRGRLDGDGEIGDSRGGPPKPK
jgi:REP element-mobilizing transposase RayT